MWKRLRTKNEGIGHAYPLAGGLLDPVSLAYARSDFRFPTSSTKRAPKTTHSGWFYDGVGDGGNRTRVHGGLG